MFKRPLNEDNYGADEIPLIKIAREAIADYKAGE